MNCKYTNVQLFNCWLSKKIDLKIFDFQKFFIWDQLVITWPWLALSAVRWSGCYYDYSASFSMPYNGLWPKTPPDKFEKSASMAVLLPRPGRLPPRRVDRWSLFWCLSDREFKVRKNKTKIKPIRQAVLEIFNFENRHFFDLGRGAPTEKIEFLENGHWDRAQTYWASLDA